MLRRLAVLLLVPLFVAFTASPSIAQAGHPWQVQEWDSGTGAWVDSSDSIDNNDNSAGNGPVLGKGTGAGGTYYTWSFDDKQYRVLASELTEEETAVFEDMVGEKVEFDVNHGELQDMHPDV